MFSVPEDTQVRGFISALLSCLIRLFRCYEYDRNFIAHTLDELIEASKGLFSFEEEVGIDGTVWHNYVFKREG